VSIRTHTQEDPIGLAGGLNLHGFAGGDPINFWDPFGLCKQGTPGCLPMSTPTAPLATERVLNSARAQGEWVYSQGVQGTPARDPANQVGDCGQFVHQSVKGAGYNVPYLNTKATVGEAGSQHYETLSSDGAGVQAGDI
jgi:hypothetical protein